MQVKTAICFKARLCRGGTVHDQITDCDSRPMEFSENMSGNQIDNGYSFGKELRHDSPDAFIIRRMRPDALSQIGITLSE